MKAYALPINPPRVEDLILLWFGSLVMLHRTETG